MSGIDEGDLHGQSNGYGYTHGCLCYGMNTSFVDYMWKDMPHASLPVAIDVPTDMPRKKSSCSFSVLTSCSLRVLSRKVLGYLFT